MVVATVWNVFVVCVHEVLCEHRKRFVARVFEVHPEIVLTRELKEGFSAISDLVRGPLKILLLNADSSRAYGCLVTKNDV